MAVMHADTGEGSEQYIVDNDYASSRVGARVSTELNDIDLKMGAHVEFEYQHNPSNLVTPDNRSIHGACAERQLNLFAVGRCGRLSVGQGTGAAYVGAAVDLPVTDVTCVTDMALDCATLSFLDKSGFNPNPSLWQAIRNQDVEARYYRVRFDSSAWGPVKPAFSQGCQEDQ